MAAKNELFFINHTGKPVVDNLTRTKIKKHVMKEIGLRRRKALPHKKNAKLPMGLTSDVSLPDGFTVTDDGLDNTVCVDGLDHLSSELAMAINNAVFAKIRSKEGDNAFPTLKPRDSLAIDRCQSNPHQRTSARHSLPVRQTAAKRSPWHSYHAEVSSQDRLDQFLAHKAIAPMMHLRHELEIYQDALFHCSNPETNIALKQTLWGPLSSLDTTSLYCSLSMLITWLRAVGAPCTGAEKWKVYEMIATGKAVKELNRALSSAVVWQDRKRSGRYANGVIVGIVAAISQAYIRKDDEAIRVHRQGLRALVEARGGITALGGIDELQILVAYNDAKIAGFINETTMFPLPPLVLSSVYNFCSTTVLPPFTKTISRAWKAKHPDHAQLISVWEDAILFHARLNQDPEERPYQTHSLAVASCLASVAHGCQSAYWHIQHSKSGLMASAGEEMVASSLRLAIHTTLCEPKRRAGMCRGGKTRFCQGLLATMTAPGGQRGWEGLEALEVWVCAIGGREAKGTDPEAEFTRIKMGALLRLGSEEADAMRRRGEMLEVLSGVGEMELI